MVEYIEFEINDFARFRSFQKIFHKLKIDKESRSFEDWKIYLEYFDEEAKSYFGWYSEEENTDWLKKWESTPLDIRWKDKSLKRKWDFESMIASFEDGEYELVSCEKKSDKKARLFFAPYSHPYGGTGCMQALVKSFGFTIIEISDE